MTEGKRNKNRGRLSSEEIKSRELRVLALLKESPRLKKFEIEIGVGHLVEAPLRALEQEAKVRHTRIGREVFYHLTYMGEMALREDGGVASSRSHSYLKGDYEPEQAAIPLREGALDYARIPSLFLGKAMPYTAHKIGLEEGKQVGITHGGDQRKSKLQGQLSSVLSS